MEKVFSSIWPAVTQLRYWFSQAMLHPGFFVEDIRDKVKSLYLDQARNHQLVTMAFVGVLAFAGALLFAGAPGVDHYLSSASSGHVFQAVTPPDTGLSIVLLLGFLAAALIGARSHFAEGVGIGILAIAAVLFIRALVFGPRYLIGDVFGFVLGFWLFMWFQGRARTGPLAVAFAMAGSLSVYLAWCGNWAQVAAFDLALIGTLALVMANLLSWVLAYVGDVGGAPILVMVLVCAGCTVGTGAGVLAVSIALTLAAIVAAISALTYGPEEGR
jgi:hypothetical protein